MISAARSPVTDPSSARAEPWLVSVAYADLASDARVLRETREELRRGARVTLLVPRSSSLTLPKGLERAEIVWLPVDQERGRTTVGGHVRFMRQLRRWQRSQRERPDIVHVHNMPDYLFWCFWNWQRAGTRVVVDVHDIMSELAIHRYSGVRRFLAVRALRWAENSVWRRADHLITVHDLYRDRIRARGVAGSRVTTVLNSPDPESVREDMRRPPSGREFKIVFHGSVTSRSGIVHAVRAMPHVLAQVPHARMAILGDGDAAGDVAAAIESLGLQGEVTFSRRYLPLHEAIERIADAHVGVVPNEVSDYTAAMLPVKLTEYATLGIPVVATALPLVRHYFGPDRVELIEYPAVPLIADALVRLAKDAPRRMALSKAIQDFAREHGWSRYAESLTSAVGIPSGSLTGRTATQGLTGARRYAIHS